MIEIRDLEHRHLYHLEGRNFDYGIWDQELQCFWGLNFTLGVYILDREYHRDADPRYGTATPDLDLGPIPDHLGPTQALDYRGWFDYLTLMDKNYRPLKRKETR